MGVCFPSSLLLLLFLLGCVFVFQVPCCCCFGGCLFSKFFVVVGVCFLVSFLCCRCGGCFFFQVLLSLLLWQVIYFFCSSFRQEAEESCRKAVLMRVAAEHHLRHHRSVLTGRLTCGSCSTTIIPRRLQILNHLRLYGLPAKFSRDIQRVCAQNSPSHASVQGMHQMLISRGPQQISRLLQQESLPWKMCS